MTRAGLAAIVLCLAVVGGLAAYRLVPGRTELGAMHLKGAFYQEALVYYQQRYDRGERSPELIAGLATLYQAFARVDRAIALYEAHVRRHPNDAKALQHLEWLYEQTDRTYDHARIVDSQIGSEEAPRRRRRLAASYLRLGNYEKWAEQMGHLDRHKQLRPDEALVVSRYLASKGQRSEALDILERYILAAKQESVKGELAYDGRLLAVALLLDMGQEKRAMALAVQSVKSTGSTVFREDVVDLFLARKRKGLATTLLTKAVAGARPDRRSLRQLTWMKIAAGQYLRAFERIEQLAIAGRLHPKDFDLLVASARRAKQLERAWKAINVAGTATVPHEEVADLAHAALDTGAFALAKKIFTGMGGSFADHHPLIGARLAVSRNDIPAVEVWIRKAIAQGSIEPARGGEVALILLRYGARQPAHDVVSHLMQQAAPEGTALSGIVAIAARVGLEEAASRWLGEAQKRSHAGPWTHLAKLFLKDNVSDEALAAALAVVKAGEDENAILRRLRGIAVVTGHLSMSQAVLRRLLILLPKEKEDLILSQVYALHDKPLEALAVLAPHRGTTVRIDEVYADVLIRAVQAKYDVKGAVFRFLPDWLARSEVPAKTRRIIVYDLIAAGKAHWVVAAVAPQHGSRPSIGNQYSYALTEAVRAKHDVRSAAVGFLPNWLAREEVPIKRRRIVFDDLVALGKAAWIIEALEKRAPHLGDDAKEMLVGALISVGRAGTARKLIVELIRRAADSAALLRYAELAMQSGAQEHAKRVYRSLLARDPHNLELMKRVALIAFEGGEPDVARPLLTRLAKERPDDWHSLYMLGEVINKFPDWRNSNPYYRRALDRIQALDKPSVDAQRIQAHIVFRLAQFDKSFQLYRALLRQHPGDSETRVQFVDVLLARGRYREARKVHAAAPSR